MACDSAGNWVVCAIYAAYIEGGDHKASTIYYDKACKLGKKAQTITLTRYCKNHAKNPLAETVLSFSKLTQS